MEGNIVVASLGAGSCGPPRPPPTFSADARLADRCRRVCQPLLPNGRLEVLLVDEEGGVWE